LKLYGMSHMCLRAFLFQTSLLNVCMSEMAHSQLSHVFTIFIPHILFVVHL
jgi:hypothetical protein